MTAPASIAVALLQGGIFVILLVALRRGDVAAAVNAFGSFCAVLLPVVAEFVLRSSLAPAVRFGPELPLWIAVAGILHSFGMLGPYDTVWWWDSLTHTTTAALLGAVTYAALVVSARSPVGPGFSPVEVGVLTVVFTLAAGVFWELVELVARDLGDRYDVEPVLVHYGWRDTALDIVFDVVGASLVVLADVRAFVPLAEQSPPVARAFLVGSGAAILGGSVLLVLVLALAGDLDVA